MMQRNMRNEEITNMGPILSSYYYSRWLTLSKKYGMQTS